MAANIVLYAFEGSQYVVKTVAALHWKVAGDLPRNFSYKTVTLSRTRREELLPAPHTVPGARVAGTYYNDSSDILRALDQHYPDTAPFFPADRADDVAAANSKWDKALYPMSQVLTWKEVPVLKCIYPEVLLNVVRERGWWLRLLAWLAPDTVLEKAAGKASEIFGSKLAGNSWCDDTVVALWNGPMAEAVQEYRRRLETLEQEIAAHEGTWVLPGEHPTAVDFTVYGIVNRTVGTVLGNYPTTVEEALLDMGASETRFLAGLPRLQALMDRIEQQHGFGAVTWAALREAHYEGELTEPIPEAAPSQGEGKE